MTQISNDKRKWHLIDLRTDSYGRALSRAAVLLMGKNKIEYAPNLDNGDYVVIINAKMPKISGNKLDQKIYYRHSGYIGNLKSMSMTEFIDKNYRSLIEKSVKGMLPKNKLASQMIKRLKIYSDQEHPHQNVNFEEIKHDR